MRKHFTLPQELLRSQGCCSRGHPTPLRGVPSSEGRPCLPTGTSQPLFSPSKQVAAAIVWKTPHTLGMVHASLKLRQPWAVGYSHVSQFIYPWSVHYSLAPSSFPPRAPLQPWQSLADPRPCCCHHATAGDFSKRSRCATRPGLPRHCCQRAGLRQAGTGLTRLPSPAR